jgi:hypothetical protein
MVLSKSDIKELREGSSVWLRAYVGPSVTWYDTAEKKDILDIWREAPDGTRYAIVQESNSHGYIVIDLTSFAWSSVARKLMRCIKFENPDQAIMACSMSVIG